MTRRFRDPVAVVVTTASEDVPTSFVWCGRRYRIDSVLTRWVEAGNWWLDLNAALMRAERSGQFPIEPVPVAPEPAVLSEVGGRLVAAGEATAIATTTAAVETDPELIASDREVWRVEAVYQLPGAARRGGVYDLVHDRETKKWQLARVWD
ncbi:MAG: hypothetical protein QG671_1750 [Actinomycetota bacterium]|nr:hypothetical protein [Actinomycetota bacterium]